MQERQLKRYWGHTYGQYRKYVNELKILLPFDMVRCTEGLVEQIKTDILLYGVKNDQDLFEDAAQWLMAFRDGSVFEIKVLGAPLQAKLPGDTHDLLPQVLAHRTQLYQYDPGAYSWFNCILAELHPRNKPAIKIRQGVKKRPLRRVWFSCTTDMFLKD